MTTFLIPPDFSPRLRIDAPPGTKVIFKYPDSGYPGDQRTAKRLLTYGAEYTVERMDIGQSMTRVYLRGFPAVSFNSVQFVESDKANP